MSDEVPGWWDCPRCQQGNDLDTHRCGDCGFERWDHEDPDSLIVQPGKGFSLPHNQPDTAPR